MPAAAGTARATSTAPRQRRVTRQARKSTAIIAMNGVDHPAQPGSRGSSLAADRRLKRGVYRGVDRSRLTVVVEQCAKGYSGRHADDE